MEGITAKIVLYTIRARKTGLYPIKLRITYKRTHYYIALGKELGKEDFEVATGKKVPKALKDTSEWLQSSQVKANKLIKEVESFDADNFRRRYFNEYGSEDVYGAFREKEESLEKEGKESTFQSYVCARKSLQNFKKHLTWRELTPDFLKSYERWMRCDANKCSDATIGIYLRNLKAIVNKAIADGLMSRDNYPFGRYKYMVPASRNVKKALTLEDIRSIMNYKPLNTGEQRAKHFWLFSYFANGLNFKDIALIREKNIDGDTITLVRSKTSYKYPKPISIHFSDVLKEVVRKYGQRNVNPEALIFPILKDARDPKKLKLNVKSFITITNINMKRIAKNLGIDRQITTYYARHSYATILRRQNVPDGEISESLGHSNTKITQAYLDGFEKDTIKKTAELLMPKGLG